MAETDRRSNPTPHAGPSPAPAGHPEHVPVHFHHWTGLLAGLGIAVVIVGLTTAALIRSHRAAATEAALMESARRAMEQPPTVNVIQVSPGDADVPLTLPAECAAFFETKVFARISGYVQKWYFDIGSNVKTGDVLATIDTPELDEEIRVAEAKLATLQADVKLAQANLDFARISSARFQAGAPQGVVSQQEADQAKSQLDVSLAQVEAAKAQVELGEADLRRLQALAAFKRVLAPYAGVVTKRNVDIGDLVTAGSTASTTSLFTICDSHEMRVFVDVPQVARPSIQIGMSADVRAREYPSIVFHGTVDRTSEAINPASETLRVEVLVPNPDGTLLPGMFAEATFHCMQAHPPVRIPAAALMLLADGPNAAVLGSDGCIHFQPITIARDLGDVIEVSKGLSGGETVALNIRNDITDGQKVTAVRLNMATQPAAKTNPALGAGGD